MLYTALAILAALGLLVCRMWRAQARQERRRGLLRALERMQRDDKRKRGPVKRA